MAPGTTTGMSTGTTEKRPALQKGQVNGVLSTLNVARHADSRCDAVIDVATLLWIERLKI
jgi:hypothetical protein